MRTLCRRRYGRVCPRTSATTPEPWVIRDPTIERPFASNDVPLANDKSNDLLNTRYIPGRNSKALAMASHGGFFFYVGQTSPDEAVRRSLESCGSNAGVPCLIIAVDDTFVVAIPATMKVVKFFHAGSNAAIAPEARDGVVHRYNNATNGWKAIAVRASGHPGLMLRAANEQAAIDRALADCAKQDRNCHVIAIGPFAVEPK
jgi:hypothetical protein